MRQICVRFASDGYIGSTPIEGTGLIQGLWEVF